MPNTVEILTRLLGLPETQRGLADLRQQVGGLGQAGTTAAPAMSRLGTAMGSVTAAAAGFVTVGAAVALIRSSVRAAEEADRAQRRLAGALDNMGVSFRRAGDLAQATFDRLEARTARTAEELSDAFGALLRITGNYHLSLSLVATAADVAAARQMGLGAAAELVGKAAIGETQAVTRMGVALREGATGTEAVTEIQRRFAGQAEASATATQRLAVSVGNLKEALGGLLGLASPVLDFMAEYVRLLTLWADTELGLTPQGQQFAENRRRFGMTEAFRLRAEDRERLANAGLETFFAQGLGARGRPGIDEDAYRRAQYYDRRLEEEQQALDAMLEARQGFVERADAIAQDEQERLARHRTQEAEAAERLHRYRMGLLEEESEKVEAHLKRQGDALQRWTGLTRESMLELADITTSLWQTFEVEAARAFAEILVSGESFSRKLKDLMKSLAADLTFMFARMGLQQGVGQLFSLGRPAAPASATGAASQAAPGAAGGAAAMGGAAGGWFALAAMLSLMSIQLGAAAGTRAGGGTRGAETGAYLGMGLGTLIGLPLEPLSMLGAGWLGGRIGGGSRGRGERRRRGQIPELMALLGGLGIDPGTAEAIIAQEESTRGRLGRGPSYDELKSYIGIARRAGLEGDVAARGLGFVTNFASNRRRARADLGEIQGGIAGLAPGAAEVLGLLDQGSKKTLESWEKVDQFFQRFARTLEGVSATLEAGFREAFATGIERFLSGSGSLVGTLRQGLRAVVQNAITVAIVEGVVIEGMIGPYLERLRDAITKGTEDPTAVIRELAGMIPQWAADLQTLLAPLRPSLNAVGPSGAGAGGVQRLAAGGLVMRPTLAVIGEAGPEAVVPLRGGGRGGLEVTVISPVEVDGREIARVVKRHLATDLRLAGHVGR